MAFDLRELELARFEPYRFEIPVFEFEDTEYWGTGKLYQFDGIVHLAKFMTYLAVENEREGADVAIGPHFEFDDNRGYPLIKPVRVHEPLMTGIYYSVGDANQELYAKEALYDQRCNLWDGVAQLAMMASRNK